MTTRRLAVQDGPRDREGHHSGGDREEVAGPIPPVPAPQANLVAILQCDNPEAIMLQFVSPSVAVRDLRREHGQCGADEAGRL